MGQISMEKFQYPGSLLSGNQHSVLQRIAERPPDIDTISDFVENLQSAKYDEMVPVTLLRRLWAKGRYRVAERMTHVVQQIVCMRQ
ncbi:MAG: hypothetical protein R3D51_19245 [Hyphomicrobiaceae bacterium]